MTTRSKVYTAVGVLVLLVILVATITLPASG
jgi:hypothetical protein